MNKKSVNEVFKWAYIVVIVPMAFLLCLIWTIVGIYLDILFRQALIMPDWIGLILSLFIGMLVSLLCTTLYWIFVINKWRIWAFNQVDDIYELKKKALATGLIAESDNWRGKYDYMSKSDELKWEKLTARIKELENDNNVVKESLNRTTDLFCNAEFRVIKGDFSLAMNYRLLLEDKEVGIVESDFWDVRKVGTLNNKTFRFINKKRSHDLKIIDELTGEIIGEINYYSFKCKAKIILDDQEYYWKYDDWRRRSWSISYKGTKIVTYKILKLKKDFSAQLISQCNSEIIVISGFFISRGANNADLFCYFFSKD